MRKSCFGDNNLLVAQSLTVLADTLLTKGEAPILSDVIVARAHAEKALATMEKLLPEDHLLKRRPKQVLSNILFEIAMNTDDEEEKQALLLRSEVLQLSALELAIDKLGMMHRTTADIFATAATMYVVKGMWRKAEEMYSECLQIEESLLGTDHLDLVFTMDMFAEMYLMENDLAKAEALYLRCLDIRIKNSYHQPCCCRTERLFSLLISLYHNTQQVEQAAEMIDKHEYVIAS